jgi:flagellar biosynthetic protein FliR
MTLPIPFFTIDAAQVQYLMLAACRLSGLLLLTPPFQGGIVPVQVRVGLALALALPLWSTIAATRPVLAGSAMALSALAVQELMLGLAIGFAGRLVLAAASLAAELVGVQIGFGIASTLDPMFGGQESVLARLYDWTMLGLFLALDMHHLFVGAVLESFQGVPVGTATWNPSSATALAALGGRIFSVGLALVAPTLGVLFLVNIVLVLASRAVPQLHLTVVGWPITVLAGLLVLITNFDLMGVVLSREMGAVEQFLVELVRSFSRGG